MSGHVAALSEQNMKSMETEQILVEQLSQERIATMNALKNQNSNMLAR